MAAADNKRHTRRRSKIYLIFNKKKIKFKQKKTGKTFDNRRMQRKEIFLLTIYSILRALFVLHEMLVAESIAHDQKQHLLIYDRLPSVREIGLRLTHTHFDFKLSLFIN